MNIMQAFMQRHPAWKIDEPETRVFRALDPPWYLYLEPRHCEFFRLYIRRYEDIFTSQWRGPYTAYINTFRASSLDELEAKVSRFERTHVWRVTR